MEEDDVKNLEEELLEEMEELIQAELEAFKHSLDSLKVETDEESSKDVYGPPEGCSGFYWGSDEIVFDD